MYTFYSRAFKRCNYVEIVPLYLRAKKGLTAVNAIKMENDNERNKIPLNKT